MPVARVERIKATYSGSVSTAFGLSLRPKSSRLRAQRCVNVGELRASRVVVWAWWDPVCRHLRLRALVLLITGECRARVGLEQRTAVLR